MPHRPIQEQLKHLQKRLCYTFKDEALLLEAITHRSKSKTNYERLEFLGDALLETVISKALFEQFPTANEGELSRLRSSLVKEKTLAGIAKTLDLSDVVQVGQGELKSGGYRRDSVIADVFESLIAAVYLDSQDFYLTESWLLAHFTNLLTDLTPSMALKDPKTRLQEHLQAKSEPVPEYTLTEVTGPDHNRVFNVACVAGTKETLGKGSSKKKAEQAAAEAMLLLYHQT